MRIKEIELDNFKSFGEKTTIPFLNGFTAVSGPNGSGKSNVIDSLMFALGLTTTRNMRAEKLTDLLNNITGKNECGVKVTFVNEVNGEEISVERKIRVKKDGYDSKYFLNGETSTLRDVHEELGKYNITPKGYNVVMQGDVASIISMNSVDRRKIVDEIAGIGEFDRKIELADKELTVVLERIESQTTILQELNDRLDQLRTQRDQAIKYAELKERRIELERQFLAVRIKQVKNQKDSTETELEELKTLKTNLQAEQITVNEGMNKAQEELNRLSQEIEALGEGKQKSLIEQREAQKEAMAREASAIEYIQKQIEDELAEQESTSNEIKELKKTLRNVDFKASEFTQEIANIKVNIAEEETKYEEIQQQILSRSKNSNLSTQTVIESQEKVSKLKAEKSILEQDYARLEEKLNSINALITKHRESAESSLRKIEELQMSLTNAGGVELREEIEFLSRNIQTLKEEQRATQEEINNQESKLKKITSELDKLEGQEQAANAAGFGKAVDLVLKIPGVHGTLAQLGTVAGEYQQAVETAAGARLRGVVTDDDYVAQECIEFLRENNAGRATFLPLNKLREGKEYPLPQERGIIDWAINLVSFDEEYRSAFSYALADTLVVKNLEVARKLIGRYRIVTLQGDLVERSGAMTGGAAVKSGIHFGADVEKQKVRLDEQKNELNSFIKQLKSDQDNLESQMEEARNKLEALREKFNERQAQSGISEGQMQSLKDLYEKEKAEIIKAAQEAESIAIDKDKVQVQIDRINVLIDKEESSLQGLAAEMEDLKLESVIQESREVEIEIKRYQTMLNNVINESKSLEIERNFSSQNIDKLQNKINESNLEVEKLQNQKPIHDSKILDIQSLIEKINQELEEIKAVLGARQEQRDSISGQLIALGQRKGELSSSLESTALKIVETKKKLITIVDHLNQLLEELKEHPELENIEIPEEDIGKLQAELTAIEKKMRAMEPINMRAVQEYDEVNERKEEIVQKQETLNSEREMLINKIGSYKDDKKNCFMQNFNTIDSYFREIFADLSFGQGELILEDPIDVFGGGLVIKAQPRGKKMQRLEAMSGGEKSLTALSFLFALQQCNPAPFYAFDEVDSALDGVNVDRLAHKVRRNSDNTQFLVVSHRRPMLEQSDRAIGVSVNNKGFSKVIGVRNVLAEDSLEDLQLASA